MNSLRSKLIGEMRCRNGLVSIPALVEDYGNVVKAELLEMRRAGLIRLVQVGDYSDYTSEEIGNMIKVDMGTCYDVHYSGVELI